MKKSQLALIITSLFAGAAVFTINSAAVAQEKRAWVAGFVDYYNADLSRFSELPKDRVDFGYGAEFGERLSDSWAIRFEYARTDFEAYPGLTAIDGYRFGVDALYYPTQKQTYVFAGLKQQELDTGYGLANIGLGRHWAISDNWKIVTEVAAYHDFGDSYIDYSAKFGIAYYFGGSTKQSSTKKPMPVANVNTIDSDNDGVVDALDKCPLTQSGWRVNASGCPLDSDNDGVFNELDQCPSTPAGSKVDAKGCELVLDSDNDGVVDSKDKCPNTPSTDKTDAMGCTMFKQTQDSIELAVNFERNSSKVANPQSEDIKRFVEFMNKYPNVTVEIEGHSSAPGEESYNLWISDKRANAIKTLLVDQFGIDEDRIKAIGYGETRLLDTSNTAQAHAKNRRITAKVMVENKAKMTK